MTQSLRWLQDEIAGRMLQKLDIIKLQVKDLLLVPDFSGAHAGFLWRRFAGVRFYSVLESGLSCQEWLRFTLSRLWRSLLKRDVQIRLDDYLATGRIALPDHSVDLVFSNLLLQDLPDPRHFLQECWRVLREGGLLTFSYLGPDTGKELSAIAPSSGIEVKKLPSPWDMHDMGDALIGARFSDPVMDMEMLTLDYESDALLLKDAAALQLIFIPSLLEEHASEFPKRLSLEIVYGHAWAIGKHLATATNQVAYIDLNQIGRKTRGDPA